jgi:hypothetical protein
MHYDSDQEIMLKSVQGVVFAAKLYLGKFFAVIDPAFGD